MVSHFRLFQTFAFVVVAALKADKNWQLPRELATINLSHSLMEVSPTRANLPHKEVRESLVKQVVVHLPRETHVWFFVSGPGSFSPNHNVRRQNRFRLAYYREILGSFPGNHKTDFLKIEGDERDEPFIDGFLIISE